MPKVIANLETMYKITVGDDGMCRGQWYPEDEWSESYYGTDLREITEHMSAIYYSGFPKKFNLSQMEVLIYDDIKYDYKTLGEYNQYDKNGCILLKERNEFFEYWKEFEPMRKKLLDIHREQQERAKKLEEIEYRKKQDEQEFQEFLKMKQKFEK